MKNHQYRVWDIVNKKMYPVALLNYRSDGRVFISPDAYVPDPLISGDTGILMKCIGLQDSNKKWIFEGDIRREEVEEEDGDRRYYLICTFIEEWSMFAFLNYTNGEYDLYLNQGVSALDSTMYWTYPTEDGGCGTICANIYEHPDYLQKNEG